MRQKISNQELEAEVNSYGAQLWSIRDMKTGDQYLWQGQTDIWELRAPVIFPYCGRIKDFTFYDQDGMRYEGQNHGFARFSTHELKEHTDTQMTWSLKASEETRRLYPYDFTLETTYRLEETRLHWTYLVKNNGDRAMPFNVGFHPGFFVPLCGESRTSGTMRWYLNGRRHRFSFSPTVKGSFAPGRSGSIFPTKKKFLSGMACFQRISA